MSVARSVTADLTAGVVISNVAARVSRIDVHQATAGASGNTFLMLYNMTTAPTGATDTPDIVYKVRRQSVTGYKGKFSIILPGGGDRFETGVGIFVATTFNGATAATTTCPTAVDVFFEPEHA